MPLTLLTSPSSHSAYSFMACSSMYPRWQIDVRCKRGDDACPHNRIAVMPRRSGTNTARLCMAS